MINRLAILILLFIGINNLHAQPNINLSIDSLLKQNYQKIDSYTDSLLFNPTQYLVGKIYYPKGNKEQHPFFLENLWKTGFIIINDINFPIPMMKYDIVNDVLVVMEIKGNNGYPIELSQNVIKEFILDKYHFIYLDQPKKKGYYSEVSNSKTKVWVKWEKEEPFGGKKQYTFKTRFVILKNNTYYNIYSLNNLYDVLSEKREELIQYKKKNKLSYRKNKFDTILKIITHYDMLSE